MAEIRTQTPATPVCAQKRNFFLVLELKNNTGRMRFLPAEEYNDDLKNEEIPKFSVVQSPFLPPKLDQLLFYTVCFPFYDTILGVLLHFTESYGSFFAIGRVRRQNSY